MSKLTKLAQLVGLVGLLLGVYANAWAQSSFELSSLLGQHSIVSGKFNQTQLVPGVTEPLQSVGEFVYAPKFGLIWNVHEPFESQIIFSHKRTAAKVPSAVKRVQRLVLDLLSADILRDKRFVSEVHGDSQEWQVVLKPANNRIQKFVEQVTLEGDAFMRRIHLELVGGRKTDIQFSGVQSALPQAVEQCKAVAKEELWCES